jgi:hypothetical protein
MTCGAATYFQYLSLHSLFSVSALKHTDHGIFDASSATPLVWLFTRESRRVAVGVAVCTA